MSEAASCPACASENVVFSKKRKRHVCEDCGHEFRVAEPFVPHRVFISYGHDEHAALAVRLRDDLRARKHEAWFDGDRLKPGHDWEASIERGLAWAAEGRPHGAVVLLLTPYSVRRPDGYCLNEVAHALMLGCASSADWWSRAAATVDSAASSGSTLRGGIPSTKSGPLRAGSTNGCGRPGAERAGFEGTRAAISAPLQAHPVLRRPAQVAARLSRDGGGVFDKVTAGSPTPRVEGFC